MRQMLNKIAPFSSLRVMERRPVNRPLAPAPPLCYNLLNTQYPISTPSPHLPNPIAPARATPTRPRFDGPRLDAGIAGDLYDYIARRYDPALARFIQPDTIVPQPGDPQSLNRYSYAANNPVRYTDPSGHYIFEQDPEDVQFIVPPNVNPTGQPIGVATWDEVATFAPATTGEFFAVISMPF